MVWAVFLQEEGKQAGLTGKPGRPRKFLGTYCVPGTERIGILSPFFTGENKKMRYLSE